MDDIIAEMSNIVGGFDQELDNDKVQVASKSQVEEYKEKKDTAKATYTKEELLASSSDEENEKDVKKAEKIVKEEMAQSVTVKKVEDEVKIVDEYLHGQKEVVEDKLD